MISDGPRIGVFRHGKDRGREHDRKKETETPKKRDITRIVMQDTLVSHCFISVIARHFPRNIPLNLHRQMIAIDSKKLNEISREEECARRALVLCTHHKQNFLCHKERIL